MATARLVLGAAALVAAQVAGTALVAMLGVPVPGAVAGLLLLLAGLVAFRGVPAGVGRVADTLLRHLNLFFVPAGVGLMAHLALLARDGAAIAVAILTSTLAGLIVAGWVFTRLAAPERSGREPEQ